MLFNQQTLNTAQVLPEPGWLCVLPRDPWTHCRGREEARKVYQLFLLFEESLSEPHQTQKEGALARPPGHQPCLAGKLVSLLELPGDFQMKGPYVSWVIFVNNCVSAQHRPTVNILLHLLQRIRSCRVGFPGS